MLCCQRDRLVGERGFEPPTPWSRTRCSTRLSHSPTRWDARKVRGLAREPALSRVCIIAPVMRPILWRPCCRQCATVFARCFFKLFCLRLQDGLCALCQGAQRLQLLPFLALVSLALQAADFR